MSCLFNLSLSACATNISSLSAHVHTEVVLGGLAISPFLFLLPSSSSFALPCGQSHLPLAPTSLLPFIASAQVDTSEVTQTQNVLHTTFKPLFLDLALGVLVSSGHAHQQLHR